MSAAPDNPVYYRQLWDRKPGLRAVYSDIYLRMLDRTVPGTILELGGGSGNFKSFAGETVSTDIMSAPWLDAVCDAQRLPFADRSFSNIVMVDTLHHVENPFLSLIEANRVLKTGGRLIFCEPAITPLSSLFYRLFHPEPVDMSADPLAGRIISTDKNPWAANQAIPTLLVKQFREALSQATPGLALVSVDFFSFLAYPLSGGFRPWSLLPQPLARPLLTVEWQLRKVLGPLAAFRLLAVYQKQN